MAFAITNVKKESNGALKKTVGQWTGAVGDAAGTITVEGGVVYDATFNQNMSSGPNQSAVPWSQSNSGNTTIVTVYNQAAVTAGTFVIEHA